MALCATSIRPMRAQQLSSSSSAFASSSGAATLRPVLAQPAAGEQGLPTNNAAPQKAQGFNKWVDARRCGKRRGWAACTPQTSVSPFKRLAFARRRQFRHAPPFYLVRSPPACCRSALAGRRSLAVVAGNPGSGGPFAPLVIVTRNIMGKKEFNQFRGKMISLHSQGGQLPQSRRAASAAPVPSCRPRSCSLHYVQPAVSSASRAVV